MAADTKPNGGSFHPTWTPKALHQVEWMSILVAGWVDAIVSHDIEEAGQHILRVEVAFVTVEGHSTTFRKLYRFNAVLSFRIQDKTIRSRNSICYVSLSVEFEADPQAQQGGNAEKLLISDAEFEPKKD